MYKTFWLIQLFFRINQQQQFFHRDVLAFPLVLTKTLAECPLIQLFFSYSFFLGAEIYKLKIFKNLPFAKTSTRKIFKNLPFSKINTREIQFLFSSQKQMHVKISTLKVNKSLKIVNYHVNSNKENQLFSIDTNTHKLSRVPYCSNKRLTNFFVLKKT